MFGESQLLQDSEKQKYLEERGLTGVNEAFKIAVKIIVRKRSVKTISFQLLQKYQYLE